MERIIKRCSRCARNLPIEKFPLRLDGKEITCQCDRCWEHSKRWRMENPDRCRERSLRNGRKNRAKYKSQRHEYYLRNRKVKIQNARLWKLRNPEKVKRTNSKSYFKNRTKISERHRQWRENNPAKMNSYASYRRAMKRGVPCDDPKLVRKWIVDVRSRKIAKCYWCQKLLQPSARTLDHITPLKRGGSHTVYNFCVSCLPCNQSKNARTAFEWAGQGHFAFEKSPERQQG